MTALRSRRWQRPWQVVRLHASGAVAVCCGHRWEITAYWCGSIRQLRNRDTRRSTYDVRRNPYRRENHDV